MTRAQLVLFFAIGFLSLFPANVYAQQAGKIYSPQKYRNQPVSFCLNFQTGLSSSMSEPCDLRYGLLGINYDFDWIQASAARGSRSIFKDLGEHNWGDLIDVPVVAALPKLKPGEQRTISIDASGAPGAPGRRGAPAGAPEPARVIWSTDDPDGSTETAPKVLSQPKVDPIFLKAIVGHMHVAHIVDDNSDYYALFRVDALEEQVCSISWKLIPTPNN